MAEESATPPDRFTARQLVVAAVALALLGVFLVFGWGSAGDDGSPTAEGTDSSSAPETGERDTDDEPETDASGEQDAPPSASPSGTPRPTLPPGMERTGPTAAPRPSTVNQKSATQVAVATVTAVYSVDTMQDDDAEAALPRVQPWLAHAFDDDAYDLEDFADFADEHWDDWADHDGYLSINVIDDVVSNDATSAEARGDTPTEAMRKISVSFTALGRDGWNGFEHQHTWYVTMGRSAESDAWSVIEMRRPEFSPTFQPLPTDGASPA